MSEGRLFHLYRIPALSKYRKEVLLRTIRATANPDITDMETEFCFNIEVSGTLRDDELQVLVWLLSETFEPGNFSKESFLGSDDINIVEIGPRMNFTTAWSSNAVSICRACGLTGISRIERSLRYRLSGVAGTEDIAELLYDRMTECVYPTPLASFSTGIRPEPVFSVPVLEDGRTAIAEINRKMGLGLDDWDIDYYYRLFALELKRNPTNVECFDLGQSNSEHSRHWFFRGKLVMDGKEISESLMQIVKEPYRRNPGNSIIAFKDNSSAIRGFRVNSIMPSSPGLPSSFINKNALYHLIFTAETHNFPSGVAPFPGAETGTGGRIRDVHAVGRGGLVTAGTAAYCVGNLFIPDYPMPWEHGSLVYPRNLASSLRILIEASNGASDYGNKFGEPLIQGFTRSFGLKLHGGERREWIKPIMFTGGIGRMDASHVEKGDPDKGMLVVKLGGPAYRIGMGGGAASSMIQGDNVEELDFNAVQRGDAEMEQKVNRVIRACVEMGDDNPIVSIHDQGAGGNCNVVKEIIYPAGGKIDIRKIILGDDTLSVLEIWGAEYQEQDALLLRPEKEALFRAICDREKAPVAIIGEITGDGKIVLFDDVDNSTPVNLDLEKVLGDMPGKTFKLDRIYSYSQPLALPQNVSIEEALERVLSLVSVGSKRFLTNKVDRSVTGLVARQQCAGPLQLTVSDTAVVAQSHFPSDGVYTGSAMAIGEQPIKGLVNPSAMARMSVGEALTNIVWAKITSLKDIRCSANWMWAAKLPGEGAKLYDAAVAMRDIMLELGIAVDGGKDSLSMAARVNQPYADPEMVKSPGALVISAYAACPDITKVITPDLKAPGKSRLLLIDLGGGRNRMGGSALAQCYKQIGDAVPDLDNVQLLKDAFNAVQLLIDSGLIEAGHDRSDGGLITTLLEMAFSGNCGLDIVLKPEDGILPALFSEELGLAIEYLTDNENEVMKVLQGFAVPSAVVASTTVDKRIRLSVGDTSFLDKDLCSLRGIWEETSHRLELLQANPECVLEEKKAIYDMTGPQYKVTFVPGETPDILLKRDSKPAVAIIREEGSNGDREMASAFYLAGFEPWDVTMTDLLEERINLSRFRGVAFVGGFSYADVLGSAKGWAGVIRFNNRLREQFDGFYKRPETFSLSVCNGCQLAALLGWVPWQGITDELQPRFVHNRSGRFESRFSTVGIIESPAIMLRGMEGSVLGIWVAHGEGRAHFPNVTIMNEVVGKGLAPVRFTDDAGEATERYPFNPNGSPLGIAGLCSPDGRHLAIMPHPERAFLKWQWGWMPERMKMELKASPWLRIFQNAREWCDSK